MTRSLQLLFCVFLLLTGCKHEEPNPELLDPIYSDLVKQQADDEGKLAAEQKALAGARAIRTRCRTQHHRFKEMLRDRSSATSEIFWSLSRRCGSTRFVLGAGWQKTISTITRRLLQGKIGRIKRSTQSIS